LHSPPPEPVPSLEIALEEILKNQQSQISFSPKLSSSPFKFFLSQQEKHKFLALAISMVVSILSFLPSHQ
jgi:hypothetical protein